MVAIAQLVERFSVEEEVAGAGPAGHPNMEGLNKSESFESFKNRIVETFKREGLSEGLKADIKIWCDKKQEENDRPDTDVTATQKATFQVELAQIYIVTEQDYLAYAILDDAVIIIENEIELNKKELEIVTERPDFWLDRMKRQRPNKVIESLEIEIQKVKMI